MLNRAKIVTMSQWWRLTTLGPALTPLNIQPVVDSFSSNIRNQKTSGEAAGSVVNVLLVEIEGLFATAKPCESTMPVNGPTPKNRAHHSDTIQATTARNSPSRAIMNSIGRISALMANLVSLPWGSLTGSESRCTDHTCHPAISQLRIDGAPQPSDFVHDNSGRVL